jgi:acetolactate synthase-1/2/3 large subunit
MIVADFIAQRLQHLGIRRVFGVGGANIEDLFAAIQRRRPALEVSLAKHEHSAGTAADAFARVSGGLGVVMTTSGGGAMNLVHALAEARASRVPLLALVGEPPTDVQGRGAFQDTSGKAGSVDAAEVFRAVATFCGRVESAEALPELLDRAIAAALGTQRGPAVLLIAKDRQTAELRSASRPDAPLRTGDSPPLPSAADLRAGAELLAHGRVLIVAGPEVARGGCEALAKLVDRLDALVAVSPDARDAFDNGDERFLGVIGAMGHTAVIRALAEVDVVCLAGTPLPLLARMGVEKTIAEKRILSVGSEDPYVRSRELLRLAGPIEPLLMALVAQLGQVRRRPSAVRPTPSPAGSEPSLRVAAALAALQGTMPEDAVVLVDAGNTGAAVAHHLSAPRQGRWLLPMGMAGMGWSFGAAIGAAHASGRRCVVLAGDGAFYMQGLEIHTAVEQSLPITYVLFDNSAHGMCLVRERLLLHHESGYNTFGSSRLAAGLGAMFPRLRTWECHDVGAVEGALSASFAHPGPSVVCLVLPEVEVPPFVAFQPPAAGGATPSPAGRR